jgi:hypothetical protein
MVAHDYKTSYSRGKDQKDHVSRPATGRIVSKTQSQQKSQTWCHTSVIIAMGEE